MTQRFNNQEDYDTYQAVKMARRIDRIGRVKVKRERAEEKIKREVDEFVLRKPLKFYEEIFLAEYSKDLNEKEAWKRAKEYLNQYRTNVFGDDTKYGKDVCRHVNVETILKNESLKQRMAKMRDAVLRAKCVNAEVVTGNIDRIGEKAEEAGDFSNALRAQEDLGKTISLFNEEKIAVNVMSMQTLYEDMQKTIEERKKLNGIGNVVKCSTDSAAGSADREVSGTVEKVV
jgi:hypothetical protein